MTGVRLGVGFFLVINQHKLTLLSEIAALEFCTVSSLINERYIPRSEV